MFGLGFTEILLIAVVALLFIGPDKLPQTMRQIAQGLGKAKRMFDDTKSSIENELRIDDLREEALQYRKQIESAKKDLSSFKNIANEEILEVKKSATLETPAQTSKQSNKPQELEDDDTFDTLFDEADREFDKFEEQSKHKRQQISQKEPIQEPTREAQEASEPKPAATAFKNLQEKES